MNMQKQSWGEIAPVAATGIAALLGVLEGTTFDLDLLRPGVRRVTQDLPPHVHAHPREREECVLLRGSLAGWICGHRLSDRAVTRRWSERAYGVGRLRELMCGDSRVCPSPPLSARGPPRLPAWKDALRRRSRSGRARRPRVAGAERHATWRT
jgi:hypothetical protein